jgi:uncharacterized protein YceK
LRLATCCIAALALLGGGCGTVRNMSSGPGYGPTPTKPEPFGGLGHDLYQARLAYSRAKEDGPGAWGEVLFFWCPIAAVTLLDIPLSVVGDLATLPYVQQDTSERR